MSAASNRSYDWRAGESGVASQPLNAWYLEHEDGWSVAVFPEVGGHGWDLCFQLPDEGYDFVNWFPSLRQAKHEGESLFIREQRGSVRAVDRAIGN